MVDVLGIGVSTMSDGLTAIVTRKDETNQRIAP